MTYVVSGCRRCLGWHRRAGTKRLLAAHQHSEVNGNTGQRPGTERVCTVKVTQAVKRLWKLGREGTTNRQDVKWPGGTVSQNDYTELQISILPGYAVLHRQNKPLEFKFQARIPNNRVIKSVLFVITKGIKRKSSDIPALILSSSLLQPYKMTWSWYTFRIFQSFINLWNISAHPFYYGWQFFSSSNCSQLILRTPRKKVLEGPFKKNNLTNEDATSQKKCCKTGPSQRRRHRAERYAAPAKVPAFPGWPHHATEGYRSCSSQGCTVRNVEMGLQGD